MRKTFKILSVFFALATALFAVILFFKNEVFEFVIFYALLLGSFSLLIFCVFMNSFLFRKALSKRIVCGVSLCALFVVVSGCTAFCVNANSKTYRGLNTDVFKTADTSLTENLYPYRKDDRIADFRTEGIDGFCSDISFYSSSHYSYYYKSKSPLMTKIYSAKNNAFFWGDSIYTQHNLETNVFEKKTIDGVKVKVYIDKYSTVAVKIDTLTECFYTEYLDSKYHDVTADDFAQMAVKQYKTVRDFGIDEYKAVCEGWYA